MQCAGSAQKGPTLLSQLSPGCAAARQVPEVEVDVGVSQVPLAEQKVALASDVEHGLPGSVRLMDAQVSVLVEHTVPARASQLPELQGEPAPSAFAHVPFLQARVRLQGLELEQVSPALPGATHTPALLHTVLLGQFELLSHEDPALGGAPQAPHIELPGTLQYMLWHCDESPHGEPFASWPGGDWHSAGRALAKRSAHGVLGSLAAQTSTRAGVQPVPLAPRSFV
jgi:hypothetical protein